MGTSRGKGGSSGGRLAGGRGSQPDDGTVITPLSAIMLTTTLRVSERASAHHGVLMHAQHGVLSTLSMSSGPLAACEPVSRRPGHPHLEDHVPAANPRDSSGSGVRVQHQDPVDADDGHADDEGRHTACGRRAGPPRM